jgi:hypothetical protein
MCATCGCGQKDKKHPKFGKGPKAKDAAKKGAKADKKMPAFLMKKDDKKKK